MENKYTLDFIKGFAPLGIQSLEQAFDSSPDTVEKIKSSLGVEYDEDDEMLKRFKDFITLEPIVNSTTLFNHCVAVTESLPVKFIEVSMLNKDQTKECMYAFSKFLNKSGYPTIAAVMSSNKTDILTTYHGHDINRIINNIVMIVLKQLPHSELYQTIVTKVAEVTKRMCLYEREIFGLENTVAIDPPKLFAELLKYTTV